MNPINPRISDASESYAYQDQAYISKKCKLSCEEGWREVNGDCFRGKPNHVSLVISFCRHDITWLCPAFRGINISNVTIYSKCGRDEEARHLLRKSECLPPEGYVVALPNVGRVDHTIAYDMVNTERRPDSVVVYLKDTYRVIHQRGLEAVTLVDMISVAAGPVGFGCGLRPKPNSGNNMCTSGLFTRINRYLGLSSKPAICEPPRQTRGYRKYMSTWHLTKKLESFCLGHHARASTLYGRQDDEDFIASQDFRTWLYSMQVSLPRPVSPVCYGGNFAVKMSNVLNVRGPLQNILISLSRGDNILEGHFAERTWAALLSCRLPREMLFRIQRMSASTLPFADMAGGLVGCTDAP